MKDGFFENKGEEGQGAENGINEKEEMMWKRGDERKMKKGCEGKEKK